MFAKSIFPITVKNGKCLPFAKSYFNTIKHLYVKWGQITPNSNKKLHLQQIVKMAETSENIRAK